MPVKAHETWLIGGHSEEEEVLLCEQVTMPKDDKPPLPLTMVKHVDAIAKRIGDLVVEHTGSEEYRNQVLIMGEFVMNGIVHGNESDIRKAVKVSVTIYETRDMIYCVVHITDEGLQKFSVDEVIEEATDPENLERIGGRGILMAKMLNGIEIFDPSFLEDGKGKRVTFVKDMPVVKRNGDEAVDQ